MLVADGSLGWSAAGVGPRVLDLYAGSGALALEALSRGAAAAHLVEEDREALAAIRANVLALGATSQVRVVAGRVEREVERLDGTFDLIFADPPYADVRGPAFSSMLAKVAAHLAQDGLLVLEHAASDASPTLPDLEISRSRRYGDTALSLYVRAGFSTSGEEPGGPAL
jgi:16S rRNA (guanine966-N2)-methyltransferase